MSTAFKTIAIIGKYKTPEIVVPVLKLAEFLAAQGYAVVIDSLTAENAKDSKFRSLPLEEMGLEIDLAVVLGGDGTLLNIARTLAPHHIPLIGVNQGRIGFLTDLSLETMKKTLSAMLKGKYVAEERLLLQAAVVRDKREVFHGLAFNEVVVHRSNVSSMVEFEVLIDGEYLYNQRADGLIISTPTGSTAYALSSGGPILHPSLDVLELVPVCPHSLSNRPLVVKGSSVIELLMHRNGDIHVRYDSHSHVDLQLHDKVIVSRYHKPALLLHPEGHSYYHTLREKLLWTQTL